MNQQTKQNEQPATAPAPAPLATVPHGAPLAHPIPGNVLEGGEVLNRVRLEPKSFNEALICAELVVKMGLGKVQNSADAMVRIMRGATIGLDAITACEQIFVVGERTGMYARLMHALILRHPSCAQIEIDENASTDKVGVVHAKRVGDEKATTFKFTIEEAAKLVGDKKMSDPDSNYNKDRKGMLIAKALSRACQRKWPDVLMGFTSIEDLRDVVEVDRSTGEVRVTPAGTLPQAPTRNFESELDGMKGMIDNCRAAATNDPPNADREWKTARDAVRDWTAPEAFKKQATTHYEQARKEWKDAVKGEAKS